MNLALHGILFGVALVPAILFGWWVQRQPWELKDKISAWDPFVKIMAIAGAIIVGLASFERFIDQRQQELAQRMIEREKPRTAAFSQARLAASTIATANSLAGDQEVNAVNAFWRLYWGELIGLEGRDVELAMIEFGQAIKSWQTTGQKPERMPLLSLNLAKATEKETAAVQQKIDAIQNRGIFFMQ